MGQDACPGSLKRRFLVNSSLRSSCPGIWALAPAVLFLPVRGHDILLVPVLLDPERTFFIGGADKISPL